MGKKIALFTTIGKLSDESKVHVHASFSSWSSYGFDVIVFGEDFHEEICNEYGFILDTDYERSEFNVPLMRGLLMINRLKYFVKMGTKFRPGSLPKPNSRIDNFI